MSTNWKAAKVHWADAPSFVDATLLNAGRAIGRVMQDLSTQKWKAFVYKAGETHALPVPVGSKRQAMDWVEEMFDIQNVVSETDYILSQRELRKTEKALALLYNEESLNGCYTCEHCHDRDELDYSGQSYWCMRDPAKLPTKYDGRIIHCKDWQLKKRKND